MNCEHACAGHWCNTCHWEIVNSFIAKARLLEILRDDIANQNRKNITRVQRLKDALRLYHHCNDVNLHLRSVEERIAQEAKDSALKSALAMVVPHEEAKED